MRQQAVWLLRELLVKYADNFVVHINARIRLLDLPDSLGVPKAGKVKSVDSSSVILSSVCEGQ
jgi:hypothetical protein